MRAMNGKQSCILHDTKLLVVPTNNLLPQLQQEFSEPVLQLKGCQFRTQHVTQRRSELLELEHLTC